MTEGGNQINYDGEVRTPTADVTTVKVHVNSTISTPNARYATGDLDNPFLGTPMTRKEYMVIPLSLIPEEIVLQYNLRNITVNGKVYVQINKGMYGLPQASFLAHQKLIKFLRPYGYTPCRYTTGLWKHKTRPVSFTLVVDDFVIKYVGRQHAEHLITALRIHYTSVSIDWTGRCYCGIHFNWNYLKRWVDLSMPSYIPNVLTKFKYPQAKQSQHSPYKFPPPEHSRTQRPVMDDHSPILPPDQIKVVQQVVGSLLYYARVVDSTLLVPLNSLGQQQSNATIQTQRRVRHLLDYCATHPLAILRFSASDMILKVHSDASYLSEEDSKSRYGGHFYLGNSPPESTSNNGAVLNSAKLFKNVLASVAESEYGAIFENVKTALPIRITLLELDHKQPSTPVVTDNSTAAGIDNKQLKPNRSKSMAMRYHWVQDRVSDKDIQVGWEPGKHNKSDYFRKHHPPKHHQEKRYEFLQNEAHANHIFMRGCVHNIPP